MRNRLFVVLVAFLSSFALAQSALQPLLEKAKAGDASAQLQLANDYRFGEGTEKDISEALRWYRAAAAKGNGEATYILGTLAYNGDTLGDGINGSLVQAWALFEISSIESYPDAKEARDRTESEMTPVQMKQGHELAAMFLTRGKEVPANIAAAELEVDWLSKHGSGLGPLLMGHMYLEGTAVPQDLDKAADYCGTAAKDHTEGAHYCLGQILEKRGDARGAFAHFKKDAEDRFPLAMMEVARRYQSGNGTKRDPVTALAWAIYCVHDRCEGAQELQATLASPLDDGQRADAFKMAMKLGMPAPSPKAQPRQKH